MAALTLVGMLVGAQAPAVVAAEPPTVKQKVILSLRLDGLSANGGDIEIKPGHAGCRFETIKFQTKTHPKSFDGKIYLDPIEVESLGADRNCSFAITLKEAGQPDKTVHRTLRLVAPAELKAADAKTAKPQELTCYLSSNSLNVPVVAKENATPKAPVASRPADEMKRKK
jgi:hypothetical protein